MKPHTWLGVLACLLALGGLAIAGSTLVARAGDGSRARATLATPQEPPPPRQEVQGGIESPAISFIDSPLPTCYRPAAGTGECYIQWNYLYVTASSSSYIISMTVSIDGHVRANHSGFFQTSMFVPGEMIEPGFKVTCGLPGAGGVAGMGHTYSYTIRARETGGLGAANYGSVTCPADVAQVFLPLVRRR